MFSRALAGETRAMNLAARYGGDEFIAVLTDTDGPGAEAFIARLRRAFPGPDIHALDFSAGYAVFDPAMRTPEDLVAAADRALYDAKSLKPAPAGG
jgi:two-component system, cell cycle response regulator